MNTQSNKLNQSQSLVIKSAQIPFTTLVIKDISPQHWATQLQQLCEQSTGLFTQAAFCLDASQVVLSEQQLQQLVALMREQQMVVFALRSLQPELSQPAAALGLSVLNPVAVKSEMAGSRAATASGSEVLGSLRSGQQHYAQGKSLVILGNVNQGAEVMADGDIHIHGSLKGRAMAGVQGNPDAKIICHSLEQAQLLAINGIYMLNEQFQQFDGPHWVKLENEQLVFKPF